LYKKDSDYALNKRSRNIIYRLADGSCVEITPEICPDFDRWKALSDKDYHEQELQSQRSTRRNVSINEIPDCAFVTDTLGMDEQVADARNIENAVRVLACLTQTQRRHLMYTREDMTTRQIAQAEGVAQRSVMDSIQASERKIKIFLKTAENALSKRPENDD
jgi:DNA-binding CsgD family transcriptional regulator